jgi:hypothetical protein
LNAPIQQHPIRFAPDGVRQGVMAIDFGLIFRGSSIPLSNAGADFLSKNSNAKLTYKDLISSSATNSDLVTLSKDQNVAVSALEKHLDDVSKGKGYLSKEIDSQLEDLHLNNGSALAANDPKSLSLYSAYSTAFTYNERAHFVNAVADATSVSSSLNHAIELSKSSDSITKSIVDLYSKDKTPAADTTTTDAPVDVVA